jgi:hypothetical protein
MFDFADKTLDQMTLTIAPRVRSRAAVWHLLRRNDCLNTTARSACSATQKTAPDLNRTPDAASCQRWGKSYHIRIDVHQVTVSRPNSNRIMRHHHFSDH